MPNLSITVCPFGKFQSFRNTYEFLKSQQFFSEEGSELRLFWQNQNVKSGI